jgi:hypothetical protein
MDFIGGVNRLFRINSIIKGDDDSITTFSDTQHAADIELAKIAIQDELLDLVADRLLDYEKASDTISLVTDTRAYALATDFIRFYGQRPSFYDSVANIRYYELKGGEDSLKDSDFLYKTNSGGIMGWYWESATTKQVAFYQIPNSTYNGRSLSYDYEKSVLVSNSTDTLPFVTDEEAYSFISCAARRFRFMLTDQALGELPQDPTYANAKARLANFLRPTNSSNHYGKAYG